MRHKGSANGPYATALEAEVGRRGWAARAGGEPSDWAEESHALAKRYLVANGGRVDEEYYARAMPVVDERLALAALRLSTLVNRVLADEPPTR